jgi:broad specificity phosphatase PhoE
VLLESVTPTTGREFHPTPKQRRIRLVPRGYAKLSSVLTLLLTRHGHTDRSDPEQYLGQHIHASLSERGRRDATALGERLRGARVDRVISSPLHRARETADIIAGYVNASVEVDDRLTELDYGAWEGLTVQEIDEEFPGERELYDADPSIHRVGGGESGLAVAARVGDFMESLVGWWEDAAAERTCLIVGHSSLNRVQLAVVMGVPLADYRRRFKQDWASLTVLRWEARAAGPMLLLANDEAHSKGVRGATWD